MNGGYPLVTAHAGCEGTFPNGAGNVVAAMDSCAHIIEFDVRATRDGVALLAHDGTIERQGGGRLEIAAADWQTVREAFAPGPEGDRTGTATAPLRLEDLFDMVPPGARMLNLDVKDGAALECAARVAADRRRNDDLIFSGLGLGEIRSACERLRGFRYLFNADDLFRAGAPSSGTMVEACRLAVRYGCRGINLRWTLATPETADRARIGCVPLFVWTVDDRRSMERAIDLEVYSVTTNYPAELASILERRETRAVRTPCASGPGKE